MVFWLFSPDNRPDILTVDGIFDIAPLVAVDDPDFTDVDRSSEEVDNHPLDDHVFEVKPDQFRGRDIPYQLSVGIF